MAKGLKKHSTNYELAYFTNKKNIQNQNLVSVTIEYFETGEGKRAFKTLEFLNLLERQYHFVVENINDPETVISHLKALSLSELEKHILFGLIIKWFGGYPVNNLNEDFDKTLKAIQKEFLNYKGETPEKDFCKADFEERKKFMKLGIAFTTAINNNMDAGQLYDAMDETSPKEKTYSTFDELFEDAARMGAIGKNENKLVYLIKRSRHNFNFNVWLQETKGLEYGNEMQYQTFLTKEIFLEYLKYEIEQERQKQNAFEKEKQSWQIEPPQQAETKTEQETIELKPVLKPEAVQIVFDILKNYFSPEHQTELKTVIETGNKTSKKLLFKGNGNRLTDTFKKLIEHDFITGCRKQDLINWIISNFTFTQQNKVKAFVYDTVEKTISRNYYPCKSPLIEIKNGQIQRFEQPRTKKYR